MYYDPNVDASLLRCLSMGHHGTDLAVAAVFHAMSGQMELADEVREKLAKICTRLSSPAAPSDGFDGETGWYAHVISKQ